MDRPDYSSFKYVKKHKEECHKCGWHSWELVKQKNRGGTWQYRYMCQNCEYLVPKFVKKSDIQSSGFDVDTVPIMGDRHTCEVCGHNGAQNHHWAPWALFGEEAESWPQSYLCQTCHTRWHQVVTPNINKQKV